MANLSRTVEIVFGGKNEVSKTIKEIERSFDSMSEPLADVAKKVAQLDAALAAMAVAGLVFAYKKSVEFETAVVSLKKVVGDAPADMAAAQNAAMSLSVQYGESAKDILLSTADFVQAGFTVKESIELTKNALDLKIAGDVSAAESSQYLVSILKGFKEPASEAARVVDILNEISNKYATNVQELAVGMAELSPIANTMGFSFEETAGLLTPVIEIFGSGSEAAMGLKTGLLKLIDDSKPVSDALASIGVSQKDANGELRSGKDILADVQVAFQNLSEPQKLFITQQLTGIHQSAKMVEVFGNMNATLDVTKVALNAAGSAQAEVDARLASSEKVIDRLKTGFENLAITIGDKFKVAVTGAVAGGVDLEKALQDITSSGAFDGLLLMLSRFATEIGDTLKATAKNLPAAFALVDWSGLLNSIDGVKKALADMFGFDASDPEDLAKIIQMVIDSVTSLIDVTKGMGEVFAPIANSIRLVVEGFNSLDTSTKELVGNMLGLASAYKLFGPLGLIFVALGEDSETMSKVINVSFAAVENGINAIKVAVLSLAMIFSTAAYGMAELLDMVPFYDASEDLKRTGERVDLIGGLLEKANADLVISSDKVANAWAGTGKSIDTTKSKTAEYVKAIDEIPTEKGTTVDVKKSGAFDPNLKTIKAGIDDVSGNKEAIIIAKGDDGSITLTQNKIEKALPSKKEMAIEAKVDTERLKAQAAIIQTSIEWKAKIDIAEIESKTKIMEAAFRNVDVAIESTGTTLSSLVGSLAAFDQSSQSWDTLHIIEDENRRRNDALELQKKLIEAQIEEMQARTKAMGEGKALIEIDGKGLQPHLEAFMFEILAAIQVRATAEGQKYLVGI